MPTWDHIGLLVLCFTNLTLGIAVYLHDRKQQTNRLFLLTVLALVGWISSISLALSSADLEVTVRLGRIGFACATPMPFALLWLFETFRTSDNWPRNRGFHIAAVACFVFVAASLSPWVLATARPGPGRPNFVYGPLHLPLGTYIVSCLAYALYVLARTIRRSTGRRKLQLRYLGVGVLVGGLGIISTNLVIPLIWHTSYYSVIGPYFTLVFLSFAAHAIIRHRLMDVKLFIRKSTTYALAIVVASLLFVVAATLTTWVTNHAADSISLTAAVAIAVVVATLFQPVKTGIQKSLNRYVYREAYDYQKTLREVSRRLSTILDPHSVIEYLTTVIDRVLHSECIAVYLSASIGRGYVLRMSRGQREAVQGLPTHLSQNCPLIQVFQREPRPILCDERGESGGIAHRAARDFVHSHGGDLAIPLLQETAIIGALILGPKKSGDIYFVEDIDLLSTLLSQASIALRNAQLYREVVLANEHIENILETMESAVLAVAADERITLCNSAAARMIGRSSPDIRGQLLSSLPEEIARPIEDTLKDGSSRSQVEVLVKNQLGRSTPVIYSTSTLTDRSGLILGVVAVFSDLTKLKELETEKRRTERLASIGAFASGIAHEIKNPLVAIKTFAELLPERFSDEDFRIEFSRVAMREIERIDELVGRLRGLVTQQAQRAAPVSLQDLLDETLALLRGHIEQSGIKVRTQYDGNASFVAGDRGQLKQLFLNLLLNSLEAMPNGGEIVVRVIVTDNKSEKVATVDISDSGEGISHDLVDRIFDPFFTTKPGGSGLGLSICRGIAEAHRATMRVSNNPGGRGVTVSIEFPACKEAVVQPIHS